MAFGIETAAIKTDGPVYIRKRDGKQVLFDAIKIRIAVQKCFQEVYPSTSSPTGIDLIKPEQQIDETVNKVLRVLKVKFVDHVPTVEEIQDIVETVLQSLEYYEAAKAYILYRAAHDKIRKERSIPDDIQEAFDLSEPYFPHPIQQFQFYDKYSRFNYAKGRRETYIETVDRVVDFLKELSGNKLNPARYDEIRESILKMEVMPSMRLIAMAGEAARRNNIAIYNCSFVPVDCIDAIVEALIISMNGCGVGYSVERVHVEKFPRINRQSGVKHPTVVIEDSTEGWYEALRLGLHTWFKGEDVTFDFSKLRPFGTPLKIKGGRSSGPEPLKHLLKFARERILAKQGSFLSTADVHDIMCVVASAAVSGGVRRSAMLALFDFDDYEMLTCKDGEFWVKNPQRWNANNSSVWPDRPLTQEEILNFMNTMLKHGNGEPGIFNRRPAFLHAPERRTIDPLIGTNPCGEILLYKNFCNLSSVVCRAEDDAESIRNKVRIATIIGTIQSMATNFPGMRPEWKENCERERLLGVDLNGQLDCEFLTNSSDKYKKELQLYAVEVNKIYADILGISPSVSVTTVKPSGNSSQLLNCSSGIHARWAPYYIRNVRVGADSPVYKVMKDSGVPMDPENNQTLDNATTYVAHFPIKSPKGAIFRNDRSAVEQCEYWLKMKMHYTEHNPSCTITYRPDEVINIVHWVWKNQEWIGGMTFLPASDANYQQMPYTEITKEEYEAAMEIFPEHINFAKIFRYEEQDLTTASQELACLGGSCEVV